MIQDIFPHKFINAFADKKPKDSDIVFLFDGKQVYLRDEEFVRYESIPVAYKENSKYFLYLFQIDEVAFFYFKTDNPKIYEQMKLVAKPFAIFRNFEPSYLGFAGILAYNLHQWYENHRFCGHCGSGMTHSLKERALICPNCGNTIYPTISPAVIVGVCNGDKLLLTKYAGRPYTNYALVAGFTEIGETLEETVIREVEEEVGLKVSNIRYYKNQPWPFTGTLLVGFFADLVGDDTIKLEEEELKEGTWFVRDEIPKTQGTISLTAEMIETFRAGKEPK